MWVRYTQQPARHLHATLTSVGLFLAEYAIMTLFLAWVALGRGAYRLEGSFFAELVGYLGVTATAEGLKLMAWIAWIFHTIWFIWALADPALRVF